MHFDSSDRDLSSGIGPDARGIIKGVRGQIPWNDDGFATRSQPSFLRDHGFRVAYDLGDAIKSEGDQQTQTQWRTHVACWFLQQALTAEGDVFFIGERAAPILRTAITHLELQTVTDRRFWMIADASDPNGTQPTTRDSSSEGTKAPSLQDVFREFGNVQVASVHPVDGTDRLGSRDLSAIVLDFEQGKTEDATLEALWPRLSPGGIAIVERHGQRIPGETTLHRLATAARMPLLVLPTGQAILRRA